jgi:hypothetical protein
MSLETEVAWLTGGFALGGVALSLVGSWLLSHTDRKHQRRVLERSKYEEMASEFLESLKWPSDLLACASQADIQQLSQATSANKVHMLCFVYFPLLVEVSGKYLDMCSNLFQASVSLYNPLSSTTLGAQVVDQALYKKAKDDLLSARDEMKELIGKYSSTYAQS